jgi:hypothetical protein
MSEDPKLFDAGDYNLFRYCHNDPIDNVDPMGLQDTVATHSPRETSDLIAAIREGQKQMARLQAYAHAMEYPGHGAIGIGTANFQIGQLQRAIGGMESRLASQIKGGIYGRNGAISPKIERGIIKVFGPMSVLVPPQTRANAPSLDTSYDSDEITGMAIAEGNQFKSGQHAAGLHAYPTDDRPNGTIFVASDAARFLHNHAFERTYVHELSNLLSGRLTGSELTFSNRANRLDQDTGMNVEEAVFGSR